MAGKGSGHCVRPSLCSACPGFMPYRAAKARGTLLDSCCGFLALARQGLVCVWMCGCYRGLTPATPAPIRRSPAYGVSQPAVAHRRPPSRAVGMAGAALFGDTPSLRSLFQKRFIFRSEEERNLLFAKYNRLLVRQAPFIWRWRAIGPTVFWRLVFICFLLLSRLLLSNTTILSRAVFCRMRPPQPRPEGHRAADTGADP